MVVVIVSTCDFSMLVQQCRQINFPFPYQRDTIEELQLYTKAASRAQNSLCPLETNQRLVQSTAEVLLETIFGELKIMHLMCERIKCAI